MKYVLLIYDKNDNWAGLSAEEMDAVRGEYYAVSEAPGVFGGDQLQPVDTATTVRVQDGRTLTTDGPFVGMKEAVGGFFIIEADHLDAAIEVAARVPAARYGGAVEIRPSEVYW